MTYHRPKSVIFENIVEKFEERGYSERHVSQAFRLLETLDYDVNVNDWDERRRFVLFDGLSKVAFTHVIDAERADEEARPALLEYALIAQCAMELVCHNKAFSNDVIQELCGESVDAADFAARA